MDKNSPKVLVPEQFVSDIKFCFDFQDNPNIPCSIDQFVYIASKICYLKNLNKFRGLNKVPLYSIILRNEIGKHYRKILDYLIKFEFIQTDNHYVVSDGLHEGKCKCYCLNEKYKDSKLIKYEITKNSLLKKMVIWKEKQYSMMMNDDLLADLYHMIQEFTVDIEGATVHLNELVKSGEITEKKRDIELAKCEKINNKDDKFNIFVKKDNYGRVHTNITNLSKHVRKNFLYYKGEKTIELDIVSSQPAMLYNILKAYCIKFRDSLSIRGEFVGKNRILHTEIDTPKRDIRDKYRNKKNFYSGPHIYKGEFNPVINRFGCDDLKDLFMNYVSEMDKYKKILMDKKLYEFFQEKWKFYHNESLSRDEIKKEWVKYVFGHSESKGNAQMRHIWEQEFGVLNKTINHFKNINYRSMSHELQRTESDLMFKKLYPKIGKDVKFATVHDCLVINESDKDVVMKLFEETLQENNVLTTVSCG